MKEKFGLDKYELFEEFWVVYEEFRGVKADEKLKPALELLSKFYNLYLEFQDSITIEKLNEILEKVFRVLWLFSHSAIRFTSGRKLISLQLHASALDGIEKIKLETIEYSMEKISGKKLKKKGYDEKLRNLARMLFEQTPTVKKLRNESPSSHLNKPIPSLESYTWADFENTMGDFVNVLEKIKWLLIVSLDEETLAKDELAEIELSIGIIEEILELIDSGLLDRLKNFKVLNVRGEQNEE